MPAVQSIYRCRTCQTEYPSWQGQCNQCLEWNCLDEIQKQKGRAVSSTSLVSKKPILIQDIKVVKDDILSTTLPDVDRVLGGGFVRGSITLIGGEPGIGKSTLSLQMALELSKNNKKTLYVSSEESEKQIFLRAQRIGGINPYISLLIESNIQNIVTQIEEMSPDIVILDSIQMMFHPQLLSNPQSISQIKECTMQFINAIRSVNGVGIIIGHITKDGALAGPKALEHLVDVLLYFEGERDQSFRLVRCLKNRFSSTTEIGIFLMCNSGLQAPASINDLFLDDISLSTPGSAIVPVIEGNRVIFVEIQALVVKSHYGMAKRTFLGIEPNRATLVLATLEKVLSLKLYEKDIFVTTISGIKIKETAADLGIALAILSSLYNIPIRKRMAVAGEIGLNGELRAIPNVLKRLKECESIQLDYFLIPQKNEINSVNTQSLKPTSIASISALNKEILPKGS